MTPTKLVTLLLLSLACAPAPAPLSLTFTGDGTGEVQSPAGACREACSLRGPLTATADEHSRFVSWSGACSGTDACKATTGAVTATFDATEFPLQVS